MQSTIALLPFSVLAKAHTQCITNFLLGAYKALFQDLCLPHKDYEVLHNRVRNEGFSFLTQTLPALGKVFDRSLGNSLFSRCSAFKSAKNGATPRFLGSLFKKVFNLEGVLLADADIDSVRAIRQVCYLAYKADLPYRSTKIDKVLANFRNNEIELKQMVFSSGDPLIRMSSMITSKIFCEDPEIKPKHGPGVTSDVPISMKFEHRLKPFMPAYSGFSKEFFFNSNDAFERLERHPVYNTQDYFKPLPSAKVLLVPKDSRGPRLISCEPCQNQYIQQGVWKYMKSRLESHPLTMSSIYFSSNEEHRRLAREASLDQSWSTLDLKDASDRVHLDLVKLVFSGSELIHHLLATRTASTVLPDGEKVLLAKFAPMGSALCFPVMAYICFILIYTGLLGLGISPDVASNSIKVYGDDIIVKTEHANFVCRLLERYGLKVNKDKSFIDSPFAESCGFDGFRGADVTPRRLKTIWDFPIELLEKNPSKSSVHLLQVGNIIKYPYLKEYCISSAEYALNSLPYGLVSSPYLCRHTDENSLTVLQSEWTDRNNRRASKYKLKARYVRPIKSEASTSLWGHLTRVIPMMGQDIPVPSWGEFSLPRRWYLDWSEFPQPVTIL